MTKSSKTQLASPQVDAELATRLRYRPQSIKQLQQRVPQAAARCYDFDEIAETPPHHRPAANPVHILDAEDGLRVIVVRERNFLTSVPHAQVLHVSASPVVNTPLMRRLLRAPQNSKSQRKFLKEWHRRIQTLLQPHYPCPPHELFFVGLSEEKGVPNWMLFLKETMSEQQYNEVTSKTEAL